MKLTLWIAVATFIAGLGKFLDEYYFRKQTRSRIQNALTRWFIRLDDLELPDLLGHLLRLFRQPAVLLAVIGAALYTAYRLEILLAAVLNLFAAEMRTPDFDFGDDVRRWLGSVPRVNSAALVAGVVSSLCCLIRIAPVRTPLPASLEGTSHVLPLALESSQLNKLAEEAALHEVRESRQFSGRWRWIVGAVVVPLIIGLLGGGWVTYKTGIPVRWSIPLATVGTVLALIPTILIAVTLGALAALRVTISTIRTVLMVVFDRASDPAKSPFTYFSSLLGVATVAMKLLAELAPAIALPPLGNPVDTVITLLFSWFGLDLFMGIG